MIFSMPYKLTEIVLEELKSASSGANVGYPPSPFLLLTPIFPKNYREIMEKFSK